MRVTFLGQAGLFIETKHGTILCDPWFNPAYFASWFPFPSNEGIDPATLAHPDYVFVSHLHHDHFDPAWLQKHVSKDATVLLPDFPLSLLENALRDCGFTKFLHTKSGEWTQLNDGLKVAILAQIAPTDGPLGDSGLIVDDGETRIFDQNDSRPIDMDLLASLGPYDAHFLQFSGAIWYPMVYLFPEKMMQVLGSKKRENEMARALRYAKEVGATFVIPSAGPPCFLDDELFGFNDFDRDPTNTFPDQTVFLDFIAAQGRTGGRLMVPGTIATISKTDCPVVHPYADEEPGRIFTEKRAYLEAYKARQQPRIDAEKASWPRGQVDVLTSLKEWFEPLMEVADLTAAGINGLVVIDTTPQGIVLDFHTRRVYAWQGEEWDYYLKVDHALLEDCIVRHVEDWINEIFLSCRFQAQRKGAYNEYVYNWFKCLSLERLEYAEGFYSEQSNEQHFFEADGYRIQRRCPHLKADLTRFGEIGSDGVLTCTLHGWQFELATGRCLTSDDRRLYAVPLATENGAEPASDAAGAQASAATATRVEAVSYPPKLSPIQLRCKHCWYQPNKFPESSAISSEKPDKAD